MPLVVYKRPSRSHMLVILPISLVTTVTLIVALSYLQVLYAACFLARSFRSSHREFPPFKSPIERAEKWTVNIILSVIPSANHPHAPESPLQQETYGGNDVTIWNSQPMTNVPTAQANGFITPPELPLYYGPSIEAGPAQQRIQVLTPKTAVHRYGNNGSSVYDTVKKVPLSSKPKLHAIINLSTLQPARSSPALRRHVPERSPYPTTPMAMPERQFPERFLINDLLRAAHTPVGSFDGTYDFAQTVQPVMSEETETVEAQKFEDSMDTVELDRKKSCHSTESYPGHFPVSDGQDMSNMATTQFAFRERGTTTVRPFSDY